MRVGVQVVWGEASWQEMQAQNYSHSQERTGEKYPSHCLLASDLSEVSYLINTTSWLKSLSLDDAILGGQPPGAQSRAEKEHDQGPNVVN